MHFNMSTLSACATELVNVRFSLITKDHEGGQTQVNGCLSQFLPFQWDQELSPRHFQFSYDKFRNYAYTHITKAPVSWTAVIGQRRVAVDHDSGWQLALLILESAPRHHAQEPHILFFLESGSLEHEGSYGNNVSTHSDLPT